LIGNRAAVRNLGDEKERSEGASSGTYAQLDSLIARIERLERFAANYVDLLLELKEMRRKVGETDELVVLDFPEFLEELIGTVVVSLALQKKGEAEAENEGSEDENPQRKKYRFF
jgi:hypothetical protein